MKLNIFESHIFKPLFWLLSFILSVKVTFSSLSFLHSPFQTHFSVCKRCIRKMDHHCPWVNNCVGENNQKYFVLFTVSTKKSLIMWSSNNTTNTVVVATFYKCCILMQLVLDLLIKVQSLPSEFESIINNKLTVVFLLGI